MQVYHGNLEFHIGTLRYPSATTDLALVIVIIITCVIVLIIMLLIAILISYMRHYKKYKKERDAIILKSLLSMQSRKLSVDFKDISVSNDILTKKMRNN